MIINKIQGDGRKIVTGGAAAGAAGAAFTGGNVLNGAGIGALSGGIFSGIGAIGGTGWQWDLTRTGLYAAAGGGISELAGGSFGTGAAFAGTIAGGDFLYRSVMNANPQTEGERGTVGTAAKSGRLRAAKDLTISEYSTVGGSNEYMPVRTLDKFLNFVGGETGPVMSFLGRFVPGFQGMSQLHDPVTMGGAQILGDFGNTVLFNFESMPPCFAANIMSAAMEHPAMVGQIMVYGEDSN